MRVLHAVHRFPLKDEWEVEIRARYAATTGEHLAWVLALSHGNELALYAQDYAARFVDSCVGIRGSEREECTLNTIATLNFPVLLALCESIATHRSLPTSLADDFRTWWAGIYGAHAYDPERAEMPCECPSCKYGEPIDDRCLFFGVSETAQLLGSYDWELAQECWDLPFEVYQMLLLQRRQRTLGSAADRQKRDAENEQLEQAKRVNSPQSWSSANAARAKALEKIRRERVRGENGD